MTAWKHTRSRVTVTRPNPGFSPLRLSPDVAFLDCVLCVWALLAAGVGYSNRVS